MHTLLVARRDLGAHLHGFAGYVTIAAVLFLLGLMYNTWALGDGAKYSHEVLEKFFEFTSGFVMVAGVLLTMRSFAEERQLGTDVLLLTSPASASAIVFGKYLAALAVMVFMLGLTAYMPALIFVNGKVAIGHIFVGYLGLVCLASATVSVGIFASSLFRSQVPAGILAGVILGTLILAWLLARQAGSPFSDVLSYAALWDKHFMGFMEGRLQLRSVLYYFILSFLFLLGTSKVLEGRRWQ